MFKRVHHVGYAVRDVNEIVSFMERYFGLKPTYCGPDIRGDSSNPHTLGALYDVGGVILEFEQPLHADTLVGQELKQNGPHLLHVAFAVDGIDEAAKRLNSIDSALLSHPPRTGGWGYKTLNFDRSKTGNLWLQIAEGKVDLTATVDPSLSHK